MASLLRRLFHYLLIAGTMGVASAQQIVSKGLPVGTGDGKIGVITAPNEECRGPATITPAGRDMLAILDRVNSKIVIVGDVVSRELPLPAQFLEPVDFIATSIGFLVVGALGDVISLSASGKVVATAKPEYDAAAGTPRLIALAEGGFALERLDGKRIPVRLTSTETGRVQYAGLAEANGYTLKRIGAKDVELVSSRLKSRLASLSVHAGRTVANARVVWAEDGRGALVAVQETQRVPDEAAFVRLVRYDSEAQAIGEAYLEPAAFGCDTVRPFARIADGRAVSLLYPGEGKLRLEVVEFVKVGTAVGKPVSDDTQAALITAERDALAKLESENGTSSATEISMSSITREAILKRARAALDLKWFLLQSAYEQQGIDNRCDPPINTWARARRLDGKSGTWVTSIPYAWGGYLNELAKFNTRLSNQYLAGNVCTCRSGNCVNKRATGMDCSGFVSYAWRTGNYYTTASLPGPAISYPIRWDELAPGDIVNKKRSHVRLVESVAHGATGMIVTVIESTTLASCGGVCRRSYSQSDLATRRYRPYRRVLLEQ